MFASEISNDACIPEMSMEGEEEFPQTTTITEPSSARSRLSSAISIDESLINEARLGPDVHMVLTAHRISDNCAKILRACNVHPTSRNLALEHQVYRIQVLIHRLWGYIVMPWLVSETYAKELQALLELVNERLPDIRNVTDLFEKSCDVVRCTRDTMFDRVIGKHRDVVNAYCDEFIKLIEKHNTDSNACAGKMLSMLNVVTEHVSSHYTHPETRCDAKVTGLRDERVFASITQRLTKIRKLVLQIEDYDTEQRHVLNLFAENAERACHRLCIDPPWNERERRHELNAPLSPRRAAQHRHGHEGGLINIKDGLRNHETMRKIVAKSTERARKWMPFVGRAHPYEDHLISTPNNERKAKFGSEKGRRNSKSDHESNKDMDNDFGNGSNGHMITGNIDSGIHDVDSASDDGSFMDVDRDESDWTDRLPGFVQIRDSYPLAKKEILIQAASIRLLSINDNTESIITDDIDSGDCLVESLQPNEDNNNNSKNNSNIGQLKRSSSVSSDDTIPNNNIAEHARLNDPSQFNRWKLLKRLLYEVDELAKVNRTSSVTLARELRKLFASPLGFDTRIIDEALIQRQSLTDQNEDDTASDSNAQLSTTGKVKVWVRVSGRRDDRVPVTFFDNRNIDDNNKNNVENNEQKKNNDNNNNIDNNNHSITRKYETLQQQLGKAIGVPCTMENANKFEITREFISESTISDSELQLPAMSSANVVNTLITNVKELNDGDSLTVTYSNALNISLWQDPTPDKCLRLQCIYADDSSSQVILLRTVKSILISDEYMGANDLLRTRILDLGIISCATSIAQRRALTANVLNETTPGNVDEDQAVASEICEAFQVVVASICAGESVIDVVVAENALEVILASLPLVAREPTCLEAAILALEAMTRHTVVQARFGQLKAIPQLIRLLLAAPAKRAYAGVQMGGYQTIRNALQSGDLNGLALLACDGLKATAAAITRVPQNPRIYEYVVTIFAQLVSNDITAGDATATFQCDGALDALLYSLTRFPNNRTIQHYGMACIAELAQCPPIINHMLMNTPTAQLVAASLIQQLQQQQQQGKRRLKTPGIGDDDPVSACFAAYMLTTHAKYDCLGLLREAGILENALASLETQQKQSLDLGAGSGAMSQVFALPQWVFALWRKFCQRLIEAIRQTTIIDNTSHIIDSNGEVDDNGGLNGDNRGVFNDNNGPIDHSVGNKETKQTKLISSVSPQESGSVKSDERISSVVVCELKVSTPEEREAHAALLNERDIFQESVHKTRAFARLINTLKVMVYAEYENVSELGVQVREGAKLLTLLCAENFVKQDDVERSAAMLIDLIVEAFEVCSMCTPPCVALSQLVHVLVVDGIGGKTVLEKVKTVGLQEQMQRICVQQEIMGAADQNDLTMDDFVEQIACGMLAR